MINVASVRIDSVEALIALGERLGECVFRGYGSREWQLESTLERTAKRWGIRLTALREREEVLIHAFQRRAHHYINDPPESSCLTEWTALLQHYGGPTRLLDVTGSLLVATFFAVENAKDDGIVWAFNRGPLSSPDDWKRVERESDAVLAGEQASQGVLLVEPRRLNRRLAAQQGAFLMPRSIEITLQSQLEEVMRCSLTNFREITADFNIFQPVHRIVISRENHSEIMRFLAKANITAATLFEGLEGFARSLHTIMRIYD